MDIITLGIAKNIAKRYGAGSANVPKIGTNNNWWLWDVDQQDYVDSGLCAVAKDGENGTATDEQVAAWLEAHYEDATAIDDGSITAEKLATELRGEIDKIGHINEYAVIKHVPAPGTTRMSVALQPNVFNVLDNLGGLRSIEVSFIHGSADYTEHYMFEFITGNEVPELAMPSDVMWSMPPVLEANKIYQVSVLNKIGVLCCA